MLSSTNSGSRSSHTHAIYKSYSAYDLPLPINARQMLSAETIPLAQIRRRFSPAHVHYGSSIAQLPNKARQSKTPKTTLIQSEYSNPSSMIAPSITNSSLPTGLPVQRCRIIGITSVPPVGVPLFIRIPSANSISNAEKIALGIKPCTSGRGMPIAARSNRFSSSGYTNVLATFYPAPRRLQSMRPSEKSIPLPTLEYLSILEAFSNICTRLFSTSVYHCAHKCQVSNSRMHILHVKCFSIRKLHISVRLITGVINFPVYIIGSPFFRINGCSRSMPYRASSRRSISVRYAFTSKSEPNFAAE